MTKITVLQRSITVLQLEDRVDYLNKIFGYELEPYSYNYETKEGHENSGTYYLDGAYGTWRLCQISELGGSRNVTPNLSKGALYQIIDGIILGAEEKDERLRRVARALVSYQKAKQSTPGYEEKFQRAIAEATNGGDND